MKDGTPPWPRLSPEELQESFCEDDPSTASLYLGDEEWHDGPGWYYIDDEYPGEGSVGAFVDRKSAEAHARECGYAVGISTDAEGK